MKDLSPRLRPVMELPIIMPLRGMVYCGLKKLTWTIAVTKNATRHSPERLSEAAIICLK